MKNSRHKPISKKKGICRIFNSCEIKNVIHSWQWDTDSLLILKRPPPCIGYHFLSFLFLIDSLADQSVLPTVTLGMGEMMGAPINSHVIERVLLAPF